MEKIDNIIEKVRNLFELANNNPNENEAIAAAAKAQELMAKYEIALEQIQDKPVDREITELVFRQTGAHEMKTWKYGLANIISKNFRCKTFCYGNNVVFYGYKEDAKIAIQVFSSLYALGNKFAVRYYNKCRKEGLPTSGVMNTYLAGFKKGIQSVLDQQCTALMIVTPQEVTDKFEDLMKGAKVVSHNCKMSGNKAAYDAGIKDGKEAMATKKISA